ncbi:MAG TPA: hypothetical protein PLV21_08565 [Cyclobacteriaceae bacterium]|nr:hypothetical protein [Cyclobacteriaceae bacterium]HRJ81922.1 hypothetical protein [Cyclobacteriaceae bacterium]
MRFNKIIFAITVFTFGFLMSCKDDSLQIVPEWESAVHGLGSFSATTDDVNFIKGDPSVELTFDLLWNSIDKKNTVTKIELYVVFNEAYIDQDGNPKTAKHGGDQGKLLMTMQGGNVPADKVKTTFSISQNDVYALYQANTFNYFGTGQLPVWGAGSIRDDRDTGDFKFVDGDSFQLRWAFTTADGRVFKAWGISVCTEFPGANCSVNWQAVCSQTINEPAGNWTIAMNDSYGDGWNGAAIRVTIDGVSTDYTLNDGSAGVSVVTVPPTATSLTFAFVSGDWDSEVTFTITSAKGNVIAKGGPSPPVGILTLDLCKENE